MARLNQIIAVEKGIKSRVVGEIDALDKAIQKPDLFNGFFKEYKKKDDEGDDLPAERKRVQREVKDVLRFVEEWTTELFEITARKDWTNQKATGDITIGGKTLLTGVPVSYLLFLEKQVTDIRTFVSRLPILDETELWTKDEHSGLFKTEPTLTHRTKKTVRPVVIYDATKEHPAQAQLVTEDIIAGHWHQTKQSGAIPRPERQAILDRVEKLLRAVKEAREGANGIEEITPPKVGEAVFGFLFGG